MTRKILALAVVCMIVSGPIMSETAQAGDSMVAAVRLEVSGDGAIGKNKISYLGFLN